MGNWPEPLDVEKYKKLITSGNWIEALKMYRLETGASLKDGKVFIDDLKQKISYDTAFIGNYSKSAVVRCDEIIDAINDMNFGRAKSMILTLKMRLLKEENKKAACCLEGCSREDETFNTVCGECLHHLMTRG